MVFNIYLIQGKTFMKNFNLILDNTSTLYIGKKGPNYYKKLSFNRNPNKLIQSKLENNSKTFDTKKPLFNKKCFHWKKLKHMIKYCKTKLVAKVNCHGPNLGLATKTKACKSVGWKCNPRITFTFLVVQKNVREWAHKLPSGLSL